MLYNVLYSTGGMMRCNKHVARLMKSSEFLWTRKNKWEQECT